MNRLQQLAVKYRSDKHGHHNYCEHYHEHFSQFQEAPIKILELGIGGYEYPDRGGAGLNMWSDYFKRGLIYGIDLFDKSKIELPKRTKIFKGSQSDGDFLLTVMTEIGSPDIIIDDASHINNLTIKSFRHLFPWLKSGGYYVIEDIESSWWDDHGFDGIKDKNNFDWPTSINFCRWLVNDLNQKHLPQTDPFPISAIHFYENVVIIRKK